MRWYYMCHIYGKKTVRQDYLRLVQSITEALHGAQFKSETSMYQLKYNKIRMAQH